MIKLFYAPETISVVVAIALHELNLPYEAIKIDFAKAEQTNPEFLQINPKGRVPALVLDTGVITETGAILEYLHSLAPEFHLVPSDPLKSAKMRETMYYLASTMHVNHAHKLRGSRWADKSSSWEDMCQKVSETMAGCCVYVEENLLSGPYVLGSKFSLADAYFYVISGWLQGDGVDISRFAKIGAFRDLMETRPSVIAVKSAKML